MKRTFGLCALTVLALAACSLSEDEPDRYRGPGFSLDDPLVITLPGTFTITGWDSIAAEINARGGGSVTWIALDLSACAMNGGGTTFDPDRTNNSRLKNKIISLVLPNAVMIIADGVWGGGSSDATFSYFSHLRAVSGANVTRIGDYAFHNNCTLLTTASFPEATYIGDDAFAGCLDLTKVSFPKATDIGEWAFGTCYALTTVNLPTAQTIGEMAFAVTGTAKNLTVTLGATPPELGTVMFYDIPNTGFGENGTKAVIVKVPTEAAGYAAALPATYAGAENTDGGPYWGEGFRGKGWESGAYSAYSTVNENISLTIQAAP
jgi:hypothetical protein